MAAIKKKAAIFVTEQFANGPIAKNLFQDIL